jgi:hypothetical protein
MKKIKVLTLGLVIGFAGVAYTADAYAKTTRGGKASMTVKAKGMCPFCRARLAAKK